MTTFEDTVNSKVMLFLSGLRSENTREGAKIIINLLLEERKQNYPGWVKSSTIFSSMPRMNPSSITRLLNDLSEAKIIERFPCEKLKSQRGRPRVFYRVPSHYNPTLFLSREELVQHINEMSKWLENSVERELAGRMLFKEKTGEDITPLLKEKVKELKKQKEETINKIKSRAIPESDPCKKAKKTQK